MPDRQAVAGRSCGECSLCCKVMGVPEVKPDYQWCPHCKPGRGGCGIYSTRPDRCRDFHCQWLIDSRFKDYWYPKRAKILVDTKIEGETTVVCFIVDPDYPTRWREEPWFTDIKQIARLGLFGFLGVFWHTAVLVKDERIIVGK